MRAHMQLQLRGLREPLTAPLGRTCVRALSVVCLEMSVVIAQRLELLATASERADGKFVLQLVFLLVHFELV